MSYIRLGWQTSPWAQATGGIGGPALHMRSWRVQMAGKPNEEWQTRPALASRHDTCCALARRLQERPGDSCGRGVQAWRRAHPRIEQQCQCDKSQNRSRSGTARVIASQSAPTGGKSAVWMTGACVSAVFAPNIAGVLQLIQWVRVVEAASIGGGAGLHHGWRASQGANHGAVYDLQGRSHGDCQHTRPCFLCPPHQNSMAALSVSRQVSASL